VQCGQETILFVEDELAILKITDIILKKLGYEVLAANSPEEAIYLAGEYPGEIQLLMTDVVMPEMNGRTLAMKLKLLYPNIRCLFTSGYTANVIAHHGVLDDDVHFIQKPYSVNELKKKIRETLLDV
jgi:response regulator RpfG family c-di-GMP phosphodiesterase